MKKHACPSCGATLGLPSRHERMFRCSYCGSVLEDHTADAPLPDAPPNITIVHNWADTTDLPSYTAPRAGGGAAVAIVALVGLAAVGAGVFALARGGIDEISGDITGGNAGLDGYTLRTASVLPAEDESGADVVTIVQGDDSWVVHYLDLDADDVTRWHDDLGVEAGTFDRYLYSPDTVYASVGDQLFAWDRSTGDRRFAVQLHDVVEHTICVDCVQLIGGTVVALTSDGRLAGYDPASGSPRWAVTLTASPRQLLDFGGGAAVLDEGEAGDPVVKVFDVGDGRSTGTLPLDCGGGSGPGIYDYLLPLPDGGFFWEGTDIITSCGQRWTPGATSHTWSTALPDGGSAVDNDAEIFTVAGDRIAVVHRGVITWYSLETGERTETVRENENLTILGSGDGLVYLGAESTRGSATWTILAVDPASGQPVWTYEPGTDRVDSFTTMNVTSSGWLVEPIPGGVVLVTYDDDASVVRLQVLDADDGTSTDPVEIGLGDYGTVAWPSIIGTDDGRLVLGAGTTVLFVDPVTGEIVARAP